MKTSLVLGLTTLLAAPPVPPAAPPAAPADSVVKVTASVRYPDPTRPWARPRAVEVAGTGVVIAGNKVLTNSHLVRYATEVHVQSRRGGDKFEATVEVAGHDVDLAVLTVRDKKFFHKRPPLARAGKMPNARDSVEVYGFPIGGDEMSVTKGVVSRVGFGPDHAGLVLQVSAAINPGNSGGPAVVDGKMVGLVYSRLRDAENIGYVIPNEEIDLFLKAIKGGRYEGRLMESTSTQYQPLENEALRALLKLDRRTQGVLAVLPGGPEEGNPLRDLDVVTHIAGHALDNQGKVRLPNGLRVDFLGLVPRLARGKAVELSVLRQGKRLRVSVPVTNGDAQLVRASRGEPPSYFIHGPLAFASVKQEAVSTYLRLSPLGKTPLLSRGGDKARFPGEELVVVTAPMFEHKVAKGYRDPAGQVLERVNGHKVKNLRHLVELVRDSKEEFLTFRFAEEGAEVLVFRRMEMNKATEDVLEDAGIAPSRRGSKDMLRVWNNGRPPRPAKGR
jgi:S1-C subfamily serine protease